MPCYMCGGEDVECSVCKGSNAISVDRCPRAIADSAPWVYALLPYFFDYYGSASVRGVGAWPDGGGRYQQPKKLQQAFDIWFRLYAEVKTTEAKNGSADDVKQ